ncbi:MAG: 4Fe-4S dicluster domain-containing protein, partial [bacterium]
MSTDSSNSSGGAPSLASLLDRSLYTDTLDCVHCGLCLTSCPTYRATGRETASPRGR